MVPTRGVLRGRLNRRGPLLLLFASLPSASWAAVPAIAALEMREGSGSDLVLNWPAVATAVDGYRVYEYDDESCAVARLVCETPGTTCTLPGAHAGPSPRLWRVAAYLGSEEGPLTAPAYFHSHALPFELSPPKWTLLSVPPHSSWMDVLDMCYALGWQTSKRDYFILSFVTSGGYYRTSNCEIISAFNIEPGLAYVVRPLVPNRTAEIFGSGHPDHVIALPIPKAPADVGLYWLSLPYDHAYSDLAALAAHIPGALDVKVFDTTQDRYRGLSRPSVADPWSGENIDLLPLRGQGVAVTVAAPTAWLPRRMCGTPGVLAPRRVSKLEAVRSGSDVHVRWQPDPLAAGGYDLVRVDVATRIAGALDEPVHLSVPDPIPAFPVADPGAVTAPPSLLFYQVIARSQDGVRGGL